MIYKLKSLTGNNFKIVLSQCVVSAGNFITTVLLARAFELEIFGQFSSIWLIILFSSSIVMSICIFPMMSNYYQFNEDERHQYIIGTFGTLLFISLLFLFFITIAYLILVFFQFNQFMDYIWPTTFCVISINLQEFTRRALITIGNTTMAFISDFLTYTLRIIAIIALWYLDNLNLLNTLAICYLTACLGALIIFRSLTFDREGFISNMNFAWLHNRKSAKWLLPAGMMQWTSINLFITAAAFLISPAAVGIIRICQSLLAVLNIILQSAENIISIQSTKIIKEFGERGLTDYLLKVSFSGCLPFVFLVVIFHFFGAEIISLIYGDGYDEVVHHSLVIYAIAYVFVFLIVPIRAALRTLGKTRSWFNAYLASSIFSISSFYFLEINFSVYGAVWGILLAHIVLLTYALFVLYRHINKVL